MDKSSRTAKSLKNSIVAMAFYVINLALQFFSRKIFLEYLGTEILGLNTTAMNLLQFLNLAELGISAAVGFSLYKPILDNDNESINEIVTLQKHLYRRIALLIIGGSCILMCFFPLIFKKITLPLWYAYASFGVLLFSSLLGYFVNYKQIILSASQQDYKVLYSNKSVMLIKVVCQMMAIYYLNHPYVWWLILEALFAIVGSYSLHYITLKSFPQLRSSNTTFKDLRAKYSELVTKIKQLFFHKICAFATTQTSPLIIYAYTTLTTVSLYGNYMIIISGIQVFVSSIFNSILGGIGNLISEGNTAKSANVFLELFSLRFFIICILSFVTYELTPEFIILWIGKEYLLSKTTLLIIVATFYTVATRFSIESFILAYGLVHDIWSPIAESSTSIILAIILGSCWGLNGVLIGGLIPTFLIITIWKPYFLFKTRLNGYLGKFYKTYVILLLSFAIAILFYALTFRHIRIIIESYSDLFVKAILVGVVFTLYLTLALSLSSPYFRLALNRIKKLMHN